jgi:hypothetical protein
MGTVSGKLLWALVAAGVVFAGAALVVRSSRDR